MSEALSITAPLIRWQGDRGTYHLIKIDGEAAEQITMHARLHRLEYGKGRGFGSVKVVAQIGDTGWKSSVFPQSPSSSEAVGLQKTWMLLISKKVMRAEGLAIDDPISVQLELL